MITRFAAVALTTASLFAQQPATPAAPATPATPATSALEAGSPAATALVDKAIAKMKAYGKGSFATTQTNDNAMLRHAGLPFGNEDIELSGGWSQSTVWGEHDGNSFVRANGRMLAKVEGDWKLRASKLGDGKPAPFALDPDLLFTALGALPADARKVAHVESAEVGGKAVSVLSLALEKKAASDFAQSGAVPGASGGMLLFTPPDMETPENEYTVYVALFVDAESGDLLRCVTKVYEKDEMMGHVQIQGAGGDDDDEADEEDEPKEKKEKGKDKDAKDKDKKDKKDAKDDGPVWKKGLLQKKPAKDESVTTFKIDFKKLGVGDAPALPDKAKALLRLQ